MNKAEKDREALLSLFMQAPAAISIVMGPDFVYELANLPYQQLVGKTESELVGKPLKAIFPELDANLDKILNTVYETGQRFVANEFPIQLDWRGTGKSEERFLNFIYAPYLNDEKKVIGLLVFAFDVSDHVTAKRAATASEKQLRIVTDNLPALISYMDSEGRYRFINDAYSKWFGKPRNEIEGRTRKELISNDETYTIMRPHEQKAFHGEPASFELTLTKPNGEFMNLDTEYLPDIDPETKKVRGIIGVGHDITQRKKALLDALNARAEVEKLAVELKAAVNSRDEFMSIASHELKTPITSLKLQLQMLKRRIEKGGADAPTPEKLAHVVEVSMKQVDRLTDLVESLLDIARIQGGRIEYSFSKFKLSELIRDVIENLHEQLERAECLVSVACEQDLVVNWDRPRIEQVLVNLISNAIKYAPGKPVQIKVEKTTDSIVRISVKDEGVGIPEDRQQKIFERFERATASRNISGLGLGLFIVSQIVKGHLGEIRVKSVVDQGAEFVVEIPLDPPILK